MSLVTLVASLCLSFPSLAATTRVALVVGNNAGGGDLPPLRYAESDASKVARVLVELGQVDADDLVLLQGRPVADVEAALLKLRTRIAATKPTPETRTVLLFYFSGHSDGEAVELGREALSYSRLKALLSGSGADVRLAIIDACRSGAGFKQKGGKPAAPFAIQMADQLNASGEAFITSSAEDEAALESSEVMGSVFTHNLVSGLRGAADASGDKLVTLAEAYRYAYDQTVARTALMPVGTQHPSYDFRISGQGELVMTSLQRPSAVLRFPAGTERSVVVDVLRDQVVAEVPSSAAQEVALPPGEYGVRLFKEGQSFGGRVTLADGARKSLSWNELQPITSSAQISRKGAEVERAVKEPEVDWRERHVLSFGIGVAPSTSGLGALPLLRLAYEPRAGVGFTFGLMGRWLQVLTVAEGAVEARAGFKAAWQWGLLTLNVGGELGPGVLIVNDARLTSYSPVLSISPRVVARLALAGPLTLGLDLDAALSLVIRGGRLDFGFLPSAALGLAFRF